MEKVKMGPQTLVYPTPALLVGANVEGKANFMTVAWAGVACSEPPMISVAIRHVRYTLKGMNENGTFSVNVPSTHQAKEVDYCGIVSGAKVDKVKVCGFKVFYGKLETAPMVHQCPVNLECKIEHTLDLGSHVLVIGKIEEVYVSGNCFSGQHPDVKKIMPLIWTMLPTNVYQGLGEEVGKAFKIGLELK
ncbi:MAG: flavin reductase family protein [Dehalococcoidia bacterium]|jgi:flavin reductase (DIM6/NTAB) family NADH-FMN oxidoreductase RutF